MGLEARTDTTCLRRLAAACCALVLLWPDLASAARSRRAANPASHQHVRQIPYPELELPLQIAGSQYQPLAWTDIPGWSSDDHLAAFEAFRTSCRPIAAQQGAPPEPKALGGSLRDPCRFAKRLDLADGAKAKAFFEEHFRPLKISRLGEGEGFVTGYYEPVLEGSRTQSEVYSVPIYRRSWNLFVRGTTQTSVGLPNKGQVFRKIGRRKLVPYYDRGEIEDGVLAGRGLEICWLKNQTELLFAQIQGSARIKLEDGSTVRINYDAHNGYPYTPVGRVLIDRGIIPKEQMSMQKIREWMEQNPDGAKEVRRQNRSYVFFKWAEVDDANDLRVAEYVFSPQGRQSLLEKSMGGYWAVDTLDFCFIRNMYFPNASMLSEMKNNLPKLLHNYGSTQKILNEKMAFFLLCESSYVTALNGLSQIYPLLRARFSGKTVLIPEPTFGEYLRIAEKRITYRDQFCVDLDELASGVQQADVVVVVNPNNPSGSSVDAKRILQLAKQHADKTFIVDESFIEFSGEISMQQLLATEPLANVLVLRSLSKSLGVPGLRLGYVYSHDLEFNDWLNQQIPVWNMNSMAENFLEIVLKHRKSLADSIQATIADRTQFVAGLKQLGCFEHIADSRANFVLVSMADKESARKAAMHLLTAENIFVKDVSAKFAGPQGFLRFAVRTPAENARLIAALQQMPKSAEL